MLNGFCHFGNWGSLGAFGTWGWVAIILQLIFWLAFIAGIVLLIVFVIRRSGRRSTSVSSYAISSHPSAKEILQARFARGEITREQYELMKQDIE